MKWPMLRILSAAIVLEVLIGDLGSEMAYVKDPVCSHRPRGVDRRPGV